MSTEENDLDLINARSIPFDVEAVELNIYNAAAVAKWCGGEVASTTYKVGGGKSSLPCVKVPGSGTMKDGKITALIGQYVVKMNDTFRVFRAEVWRKKFVPIQNVDWSEEVEVADPDKPIPLIEVVETGTKVRVINESHEYFEKVGLVFNVLEGVGQIVVGFPDVVQPQMFVSSELELA